jgi:Cytochrome c oxidase assembly protein CtaG/Cox11
MRIVKLASLSNPLLISAKFTERIIVFVALLSMENVNAADRVIDMSDAKEVIQAYVRATYARDFLEAYRFISAEDRKVRDVNRYVQQRGAFSGFTLQVGRKLSESIQVTLVKKEESSNRARFETRYKVPDPAKIAPLVGNWDRFRLNALPAAERNEILKTLEERKNNRAIEMSEGKEKFELVKENGEWRVFLNWAAGVGISLRLDLAKAPGLDVRLSTGRVVVVPGDLFEINLKIKNPTQQPVIMRIGHLVEPQNVADYLDFVQCGFLLPVTVAAGEEQEYSGTYMLRGSVPEGVRQLTLNYDFRVVK